MIYSNSVRTETYETIVLRSYYAKKYNKRIPQVEAINHGGTWIGGIANPISIRVAKRHWE